MKTYAATILAALAARSMAAAIGAAPGAIGKFDSRSDIPIVGPIETEVVEVVERPAKEKCGGWKAVVNKGSGVVSPACSGWEPADSQQFYVLKSVKVTDKRGCDEGWYVDLKFYGEAGVEAEPVCNNAGSAPAGGKLDSRSDIPIVGPVQTDVVSVVEKMSKTKCEGWTVQDEGSGVMTPVCAKWNPTGSPQFYVIKSVTVNDKRGCDEGWFVDLTPYGEDAHGVEAEPVCNNAVY